MRHAYVATWLLAFTACGTDRLSDARSELRASPEVLRWETSFVGFPVERSLQVENRGRTARTAELKVEGPFRVASTVVELPAGATLSVPVLFEPSAPGRVTATLTLVSEDLTLSVGLEADAFPVPDCGTPAPCRQVTFDPSSGACVDAPLPDETRCSSPCLDVGTCHAGECLGSSPTCDDGNRCTQDACDPERGCIHLDASDTCVAPAEACKVAYCDPKSGCGITDAVDGTPCGDADCVSANICLNGQCKIVPVPEGASCAPQSPCQAPGVCQQQLCVRPAATPLQPAWTYEVAPTKQLLFTGVADGQGNLYWAECLSGACELVSFTRDGFERYRVPIRREAGGGGFARGAVVWLDGSVLVASYDTVQSFRASDGVEQWFHDFRTELLPNAGSSAGLQVGPIVDLGGGRIAVRAVRFDTDPQAEVHYESAVVALSTAQGQTEWQWRHNGYSEGLVAQPDGTTWFHEYPRVAGLPPRLVALTRAGAVKFNVPIPGGKPLATYGDRLVLSGGELVSTLDATQMAAICPPGAGEPYRLEPLSPLLGNGIAYTVCNSWGWLGSAREGMYVRRFDPSTGNELWAQRLDQMGTPSSAYGTSTSQPALLADDGMLVARGDVARNAWQLLGVSKEGSNTFACDLPFPGVYQGAVIANGRWSAAAVIDGVISTYSVLSFDVPGAPLATKGWTVLGGNPGNGGRPR